LRKRALANISARAAADIQTAYRRDLIAKREFDLFYAFDGVVTAVIVLPADDPMEPDREMSTPWIAPGGWRSVCPRERTAIGLSKTPGGTTATACRDVHCSGHSNRADL
jgi:hypothetical protein